MDPTTTCHVTRFTNGSCNNPPHHPARTQIPHRPPCYLFHEWIPHPPAMSPVSPVGPATTCHDIRFTYGSCIHPPFHPFHQPIPRPPATSSVLPADPTSNPISPVSPTDPMSIPQFTCFANRSHVHLPCHRFHQQDLPRPTTCTRIQR